MKKIFLLNFILIFTNLFSQNNYNSGEVIYSIKMKSSEQNKNPNTPPRYQMFKNKLNEFSKKLEYRLIFNKNESLFNIKKNLAIDNDDNFTKLALAFNKGNSIYYTNKNNLIEQTTFLGQEFLIKSSFSDLKWKLDNIEKKIGEYTCYRATVKMKRATPNGDTFFICEAWYTPEIPLNYGPFEYNNLPGLILELTIKDRIFLATSIKFKKEDTNIDRPKNGKLISKKEFDEIGKKAFENR